MVQNTSEPRIPAGMSFFGFLVSWAAVDTDARNGDLSATPYGPSLRYALSTDVNAADTLTWTIDTPATNGTASVTTGTGNSQVINYTPNTNYFGTDSFVVKVDDGNGGFKKRTGGFDGFGRAPAELTDAYILWALTESGAAGEVRKELDAQHAVAKASNLPVTSIASEGAN